MAEYVTNRNETTVYDYEKTIQYTATDAESNFIQVEMIVKIP